MVKLHFILSVVLLSGFCLTSSWAEVPFLKVGITVPLSGGLSDIGQSFKNGVLLASQENDPENSRGS